MKLRDFLTIPHHCRIYVYEEDLHYDSCVNVLRLCADFIMSVFKDFDCKYFDYNVLRYSFNDTINGLDVYIVADRKGV